MAGSINKVILIGNLGADPEVRYLESGVSVASIRIATSESFKDRQSGERKTQTEWHSIVLWRGLAEIAEKYLKKGSQIYVEGKLRTRTWQDKDGNTRYTTEVVGDNLTMLGRANEGAPTQNPQTNTGSGNTPAQGAQNTSPQNNDFGIAGDETDDLPF